MDDEEPAEHDDEEPAEHHEECLVDWFVEPSLIAGRWRLPHQMMMQWELQLLLEVAVMVTCVSILDSISFWLWKLCFFSHVFVQCLLVPFDFEVAFHDRNMATPPAPLLPSPKPASARRRPVVVKVHKKYEFLGEVQGTFAIIQLKFWDFCETAITIISQCWDQVQGWSWLGFLKWPMILWWFCRSHALAVVLGQMVGFKCCSNFCCLICFVKDDYYVWWSG